jgi:hypothetical protein
MSVCFSSEGFDQIFEPRDCSYNWAEFFKSIKTTNHVKKVVAEDVESESEESDIDEESLDDFIVEDGYESEDGEYISKKSQKKKKLANALFNFKRSREPENDFSKSFAETSDFVLSEFEGFAPWFSSSLPLFSGFKVAEDVASSESKEETLEIKKKDKNVKVVYDEDGEIEYVAYKPEIGNWRFKKLVYTGIRVRYVYVNGVFYHWTSRDDKRSSYGRDPSFMAGQKQKPVIF